MRCTSSMYFSSSLTHEDHHALSRSLTKASSCAVFSETPHTFECDIKYTSEDSRLDWQDCANHLSTRHVLFHAPLVVEGQAFFYSRYMLPCPHMNAVRVKTQLGQDVLWFWKEKPGASNPSYETRLVFAVCRLPLDVPGVNTHP